jgi:ATP-dependent helicase/nuclease subunit A
MTAVDAHTAAAQAKASDPANSAWVSANAGSGKTFVLSRRVIRLLLAGIDPSRILCLTFTKAAAAEMAKRVFDDLAGWTTLSDDALARTIADIEGKPPSAALVARARRLFASALDTPGGLKVQTIHAFCERLLHQFPFEANVAGHFEVLDERDQRALAVEARRAVLARAAEAPDGDLGRALATVLSMTSDRTHDESVAGFVDKRDQIEAWIVANGDLDGAIADLAEGLEFDPAETAAALRREIVGGAYFDSAKAAQLIALLERGSSNDIAAAERLRPYTTSDDHDTRCAAYLAFFMKDNGEFRKPDSLVTKKTKASWSELDRQIPEEMARIEALFDRIRTAEVFESSVAMLRLADAAIGEYARLKRARGVLDFEDLVVRTVTLLSRTDASRWVHYKLDRGLDHILVDEAQDTSPRQWQVVRALAGEFFAGEGASETLRTLFAVGDDKQSIFSFQGAVPAWFTRVQREIGLAARAGSYLFEDVELHLSFRSTPVVLQAVDKVFEREAVHAGLSAVPQPPQHDAWRRDQPGRVVLWPAIKPPEKPAAEDWIRPLDYLASDSPEVTLAAASPRRSATGSPPEKSSTHRTRTAGRARSGPAASSFWCARAAPLPTPSSAN